MAGWVYVIEFSDLTVKVGRATDFFSRLAEHERSAQNFGLDVNETWAAYVENPGVAEQKLLEIAAKWGGKPRSGREWFDSLSFDAMVQEGDIIFGISPLEPYGPLWAEKNPHPRAAALRERAKRQSEQGDPRWADWFAPRPQLI